LTRQLRFMNFLAHIYLSTGLPDVTIGNVIGDFVKGKSWENYPMDIQKGIHLHREIDRFTDVHEVVTKTKERLRPKYRHYAPVIGDVFYDHFLARNWNDYHDKTLIDFTQEFYQLTNSYSHILPEKAKHMLIYMKRDNWLLNYQHMEGIDRALTGMSRRTPFNSKMEDASEDLKNDYEAYKAEFTLFFPDLISHSKDYLASL
jgi:acyl carrier protein phosphodiesterase